MRTDSTRSTLVRWRTARRAVLGAIVLAGSVVTSAAVMMRLDSRDCSAHHVQRAERAYTYSGIGVVIERHHGEVVVRRVLRGSPAEGLLRPGTRLTSVDDHDPPTLEGWASAIRGEPGTTVEIGIKHRCGGEQTVAITRDIVRMAY